MASSLLLLLLLFFLSACSPAESSSKALADFSMRLRMWPTNSRKSTTNAADTKEKSECVQ